MKKHTFEDAKVGDRVWNPHLGWGIINYVNAISVRVHFGGEQYKSFTWDGNEFIGDLNPSLFWDKFPIPTLPISSRLKSRG